MKLLSGAPSVRICTLTTLLAFALCVLSLISTHDAVAGERALTSKSKTHSPKVHRQATRADSGQPGVYEGKPQHIDVQSVVTAALLSQSRAKTQSSDDCQNGNFESGTFSGWHLGNLMWFDYGKTAKGVFISDANLDARTDPYYGQHAIVPNNNPEWVNWQAGHLDPTGQMGIFSTSIKPTKFFDLPLSCNGSKAMRLGNPQSSYENNTQNKHDGETATFPFVVTPINRNFGFRFAAFVQSHTKMYFSPAFNFYLLDHNGNPLFLTSMQRTAQSPQMVAVPNSGSSASNQDYWYYQAPMGFVFEIPPSYIGRTLYAVFVTHGCGNNGGSWGGHSAYAFIDDLCDQTIGHAQFKMSKDKFCSNEKIIVDGSCSVDAKSHVWRVQECNSSGAPVGNVILTKQYTGRPSAGLDIAAEVAKTGKPLVCGRYYRVTLDIVPNVEVGLQYSAGSGPNIAFNNPQTQSFTSKSSSKVFHLVCSEPELSPLKAEYCQGEAVVVDGSRTDGEISYEWSMSRLDPSGNEVLSSRKGVSGSGSIGGPFDILKWYASAGGITVCDSRYRVKLKAFMPCSPNGAEVSQTFLLKCCKDVDCCSSHPLSVVNPMSTYLYPTSTPGEYGFNPSISRSGGGVRRVEMMLANVACATLPWSGLQPSFGYVQGALGVATSPNLLPVASSIPFIRMARWEASGNTGLSGAILPVTLRFAPPVAGKQNFLRFTIKVTVYDADCQTCEVYQSYVYKVDGSGPLAPLPLSAWPKSTSGVATTEDAQVLDRIVFTPRTEPDPFPGGKARSGFPGLTLSATAVWPPSLLFCCPVGSVKVSPVGLRATQSAVSFAFTPQVSSSMPAGRIEVGMVSVAAATPSSGIQAVHGFIYAPSAIAQFAPPQLGAVPFSHIARWVSSGATVSNIGVPMMLAFPAPPVSSPLFLRFTMRYSVSSTQQACRQCDVYETYYYRLEKGKAPVSISPKDWPIKIDGPPDNGPGSPNKRGGGGTIRERR